MAASSSALIADSKSHKISNWTVVMAVRLSVRQPEQLMLAR
jgi:hypothetical protein